MTETNNTQCSPAERHIDVATVHQTAVSLLSLDHQNFWQIAAQYLLALTVLSGFVAFSGADAFVQSFVSALGILICSLWNGNIKRSNSWRDFRAKQIQNIESLMPQELRIVTEAESTRDQGHIDGPPIRRAVRILPWAFIAFFIAFVIRGIVAH